MWFAGATKHNVNHWRVFIPLLDRLIGYYYSNVLTWLAFLTNSVVWHKLKPHNGAAWLGSEFQAANFPTSWKDTEEFAIKQLKCFLLQAAPPKQQYHIAENRKQIDLDLPENHGLGHDWWSIYTYSPGVFAQFSSLDVALNQSWNSSPSALVGIDVRIPSL